MDIFDKRIIGYSSVKNTLRKIADILHNPVKYKSKDAVIPKGLLLSSLPGTGKTTLAKCLIEASGRNSVVFCKDSDSNNFLDDLKEAFQKAYECMPSIILLEDIHSYSTSMFSSEWAGLQSCIDKCNGEEVFVVATTNTMQYIPQSLLRPGRFDYILKLDLPTGKTAESVLKYYLRDKNIADDVNISDVVKVLDNFSCATLESALNVAAINAAYEGCKEIHRSHLVDAIMQVVYQMRKSDKEYTEEEIKAIALHEASHAVVSETLNPGKTAVVTILSDGDGAAGLTDYYDKGYSNEEDLLNLVTISLAGKAGVEMMQCRFDVGAREDLNKAYGLLSVWVTDLAGGGFHNLEYYDRNPSEDNKREHEKLISVKMNELYDRAKKILFDNKDFLVRLWDELVEKETLLNSNILNIKENKACT